MSEIARNFRDDLDIRCLRTPLHIKSQVAIAHDAQSKILTIDGVDEADVQLVWDPPWNQNMISEAGRMKLGMV